MKKNYRKLFFLAIFCINFFYTQAQVVCDSVFLKEFSADDGLEPYATKQLSTGGTLIVGKKKSYTSDDYKGFAVKLSESGKVIWSVYGNTNTNDYFTGVVELEDKSFMFYGITQATDFLSQKILLLKVNAEGEVIWSKQLGVDNDNKQQLNALKQNVDGDLVGTFNINDSTENSDPVVFKISLDGTISWIRRFNNEGAESFNAIAFSGNHIYLSGFYTQVKKRGVLLRLNNHDGGIVGAENIYYHDLSYDQELQNVEIFDNKISFGINLIKLSGNEERNQILLVNSDFDNSENEFQFLMDNGFNEPRVMFMRTQENGFAFLKGKKDPTTLKMNSFGYFEWSTRQSNDPYLNQINLSFDVTKSGGTISTGFYKDYLNGGREKMVITKTNTMGKAGGCTSLGNWFFIDSVSHQRNGLSWKYAYELSVYQNQNISFVNNTLALSERIICKIENCVDKAPLPEECNKTIFTEYTSDYSLILRDAVTTSDGGKIGVGSMQSHGWVVKFKNNGDVDWSRKIDKFSHNHIFSRILRSSDDKFYVFGDNDYTVDHYNYGDAKIIKLNTNGDILLSKDLVGHSNNEIADVSPTPDGGFIVLMNGAHGSGYLYSYVLRYDSLLNVVWKKEIMHNSLAPIYRSVYCTDKGVWFGHDAYNDNGKESIGIQKLDYNTGNNVWNKGFKYPDTYMSINKIIVVHDTLYAFLNRRKDVETESQMVMLKLKDDGTVIESLLLQTDPLYFEDHTSRYMDLTRPTVTLTPHNDFIMSNQVKTITGKALNISKFDTKGVALWSKNYTGLDKHTVFNIKTQATGIVILGLVFSPNSTSNSLGAFMLKTDSMGVIINGSVGVCSFENKSFTSISYLPNEVDSRIDSVVDEKYVNMVNASVTQISKNVDATLYCHEQSACTAVSLVQKNSNCTIQDPLVFYFSNKNCGINTKWRYDTAFFNVQYISQDTLKLLAKHPGVSLVEAEVEDDCSIRVLGLDVSVLLSASSINLGRDTVLCRFSDPIIVRAGPGYNTYKWNDNSMDSVLVVTKPGIYSVTVTDLCGGEATDSILVTLVGNDFKIVGESDKCNNDTVRLVATEGYINYQWTPANDLTSTNNIAIVNPVSTTSYYIQAEKFPGCVVRDTFLLTVKKSPQISIGKDTIICYDQSITLTASDGFEEYLWNTGSITKSIVVSDAGMYTMESLYANGCVSRDTINVSKHAFNKPWLGNDTSICYNTNYLLTPGNYTEYLWNTGSVDKGININSAGVYSVTVKDFNGCLGEDTIEIKALNYPPQDFLHKSLISICYGESLTLSTNTSFNKYSWSNGSAEKSINVSNVGIYTIEVTDANGCIGKDTAIVSLKNNCTNAIYFPTAFTPNGNGKNDIYRPVIYGQVQLLNFEVYNRWGERLFRTSSNGVGWDGKVNGVLQDGNTFIWVCQYQILGEQPKIEKGTFVLIR